MKTPYTLRASCLIGIFVLICLCLTLPLAAQTVENSDGTKTKSDPIDFGMRDSGPIKRDVPFFGPGTRQTTTDQNGKVTNVKWLKKNRVKRAVFFERQGDRVVVTRYNYKPDGKTPTSKSEKTFSATDGKKLSDNYESYDDNGTDVATGSKKRLENGKWVASKWNSQTQTWVPSYETPASDSETLDDVKQLYGAEDVKPAQGPTPQTGSQVSYNAADGEVFSQQEWAALNPYEREAAWWAMWDVPDQQWDQMTSAQRHEVAMQGVARCREWEASPERNRLLALLEGLSSRVTSRWSVSVGGEMSFGNVKGEFAPRLSDFGLVAGGDTLLKTIGSPARFYGNGSVDQDLVSEALGLDPFTGGIQTPNGTTQIAATTFPRFTQEFQTNLVQHDGEAAFQNNTFFAGGPTAKLVYHLAQFTSLPSSNRHAFRPNIGLSVWGQYSYQHAEQSFTVATPLQGWQYNFFYDGIRFPNGQEFVVIDNTSANAAGANPPLDDPTVLIDSLSSRVSADFRWDRHRFVGGIQLELSHCKDFGFTFAVGPTVTVNNLDVKYWESLLIGGSTSLIKEDSCYDTNTQVGVMMQLGLNADIGKRFFVEGYVRGEWSNPIKLGGEVVRAEIGDFSGGLGGAFGIRF